MIELRAYGSSETSEKLATALVAAGVRIGTLAEGAQAVVTYGLPLAEVPAGVPVLNAACGTFDKFEELQMLAAAGIKVPAFSVDGAGLAFPLLARRRKHSNGRDIAPVFCWDQLWEQRRAANTHDFFTQYVPRATEFRVWAYRRQPLVVYEKYIAFPERSADGKRKLSDALALRVVEDLEGTAAASVGAAAVQACGLDFGAVDIILGQDGELYVLEVNTAPSSWGRWRGISRLAAKIARWEQLGYPRRRQ